MQKETTLSRLGFCFLIPVRNESINSTFGQHIGAESSSFREEVS